MAQKLATVIPESRQTFTAPPQALLLSAASSDDALRAALRANPSLPNATYGRASAAHHRLLQSRDMPISDLGVSQFWAHTSQTFRTTMPRDIGTVTADNPRSVAALRIMLDAAEALEGLEVSFRQLNHADLLLLRGDFAPQTPEAMAALHTKCPGLAAWNKRRQSAAEAAQADIERGRAQAEVAQAEAQAMQRQAAAVALLRRLAGEGVTLSAPQGELLAHPAPLLTQADRAALIQQHDELVALLQAPAEAVA